MIYQATRSSANFLERCLLFLLVSMDYLKNLFIVGMLVAFNISNAQQGLHNSVTPVENSHVSPARPNHSFFERNDLLWKKIVWRVIDITDKPNEPLRTLYNQADSNVNFTTIITNAIRGNKLAGFKKIQDSSAKVSKKEMLKMLSLNRQGKKNSQTNLYLLEEEVSYVKNAPKMDTRTLKIGPLPADTALINKIKRRKRDRVVEYNQNGIDFGGDDSTKNIEPLFWMNFAQLAPIMKNYYLKQPVSDTNSNTCQDFFINRDFFSQVIRIKSVYKK